MCGIASYFGPGPFDPGSFLRELAHRGPDARGTWSVPTGAGNQVSLVHTRLSILDLSPAGNQPMLLHPLPDGRWRTEAGGGVETVACGTAGYAVAFNGEIYNFAGLRAELQERGHSFSSSGDTEVLLRGYAEWGPSVFAKLDGIFAVALYDGPGRRLVVARDHMGIKPLYFGRARDGGFLFASQVRAIVASGLWDGRINRTAILDYLRFGSFQEPATAFSGICAFEPGCVGWVKFDDGVPGIVRTERYWAIEHVAADNAKHDWRAEHSVYLKQAVEEQLISDVPVGVFLSGGLDSTLILELAATTARDRLTAFTVGGELATNDEAGIAARTAANLGVKHLLVRPSRVEQEQWIKQALLSMDQPSCDGVNTYIVSRASRAAGLVVALGGTGADELHGAYGHASTLPRLMRLTESFSTLSRPFGRLAGKVMEYRHDAIAGERLRLMLDQVRSPWRLLQEKRRFFTTTQIEALWPEGSSLPLRWQAPAGDEAELALLSDESQITIAEARGYLLNTLLRDSDWATMANQQELRVPFLGRRYVEFMLRMPAALKAPQGSIKKPLLAAMISPVNRSLIGLPKRGFSLNYAELLLGPMREEFCADCEWLNERLSFRINARAQLNELRSSSSAKVANRLWALFALGSYLSRHAH